AFGDMMIRNPKRIGPSLPEPSVLEMNEYIASVRPQLWDGLRPPSALSSDALKSLIDDYVGLDARDDAIALGVSCEACHLGCLQHAEDEKKKPAFTASSPYLHLLRNARGDNGRSQQNINAICARCHTGQRPTYAAGMSTWNSTEHSDAMRGACYSQLSCIKCHDPHAATGKVWPKTPEQDDASCIDCHQEYTQPEVRFEHTKHPAGSPGDRCMNCHMPQINEGMQDVVRTHTIFSPTQADMIHENQPNACNLCHLDKSIEWTVKTLGEWYAAEFDPGKIQENYPNPDQAVGLGWLTGKHQPTRLVAAEAFARQQAQWGLAELVGMLNDPYLLNRQFAQKAVELLTQRKLDAEVGYWYYQAPSEREPRIAMLRKQLGLTASGGDE
ncbi:MAG: hypothetical protein NXI32_24665, partial [bacterium]|nr:hypothetical protein [bacterium]